MIGAENLARSLAGDFYYPIVRSSAGKREGHLRPIVDRSGGLPVPPAGGGMSLRVHYGSPVATHMGVHEWVCRCWNQRFSVAVEAAYAAPVSAGSRR